MFWYSSSAGVQVIPLPFLVTLRDPGAEGNETGAGGSRTTEGEGGGEKSSLLRRRSELVTQRFGEESLRDELRASAQEARRRGEGRKTAVFPL